MYDTAYHGKHELVRYGFLVTGGAGFIGSHLVEYLFRHTAGKVRIMDNLSTGSMDNLKTVIGKDRIEFIRGDVTQYANCIYACKGMDYVVHLAALGSVPRSVEDPIATHHCNVTGSLNLFAAARDTGVERVVFASSSSVYGDEPSSLKTENRLGLPLSPYAASKNMAEMYAALFAKLYKLNIVGLRFFNVFGPRQNSNGAYAAAIPAFLSAFLGKTQPVIYGDGTQTRDFNYVENAVQAIIKTLFAEKTDIRGRFFNIAGGQKHSVNELLTLLKKLTGNEMSEPRYEAAREGEVKHSCADISSARSSLQYEPLIGFEEGLKLTAESFKNNPH